MRYLLILFLFFLSVTNTSAQTEEDKPASYYEYLGSKYADRGDLNTAIIYFQKAIQQDPNYLPAYINLGVSFGKKGEYDKGIEILNKALEINPNVQEIYVNLSAIYEKKKDYDNTVDYAQKALLLNRNNVTANYLLGSGYIMQGKTELAIEQYRILSNMNEDTIAVRLLNKIIQKATQK